eukprot:m.91896 g.91896  ORF g.91896 m.91896 type:complete len:152 (+) comp8621_c0_seq1:565-1020(+)
MMARTGTTTFPKVCARLSSYLRVLTNKSRTTVSVAAVTIYVYTTLVPFLLWLFLRVKANDHFPTLLSLGCLFGYSLVSFIPSTILCAFPMVSDGVRWGFVSAAFFVSAAVLVLNLNTVLKSQNKQILTMALGGTLLAQLGLSLGFKLYFLS